MADSAFKIQLEHRTLEFSISVIKLFRSLPLNVETRTIRDQVLRSSTSIGANYREANRAESSPDFRHKMAIVTKEAAETEYWIQILHELHPGTEEVLPVLAEASELVRIFAKSLRTLSGQSGPQGSRHS